MSHIRKYLQPLLIIIVTVILSNYILTLTYYNPAIAVAAYRRISSNTIIKEVFTGIAQVARVYEGVPYPQISIERINDSLFWKPRALVVGTVTEVQKVDDGDWHVNVTDEKKHTIVCEIIPEYPLPIPHVGDVIQIWGITRYDLEHRWWELHPVIGWKKVNDTTAPLPPLRFLK